MASTPEGYWGQWSNAATECIATECHTAAQYIWLHGLFLPPRPGATLVTATLFNKQLWSQVNLLTNRRATYRGHYSRPVVVW